MVITADKNTTDGVMHKVCNMIDTDIPIVLLSRVDELNFNEEILSLKDKKFVVVDVIEMGWDVPILDTLIVGTDQASFMKGEGWERLSEFLNKNNPSLYFKRELLNKDVTDTVKPIEYPNWQPEYPAQTKEQFDSRPISVMNYWGRSHEARLMLHGEIWKNAARKGYAVCDNVFLFNQFMAEEANPNKWLSFWMPHYNRLPIEEVLAVNGMSKLSISLPGAGIKCFRSTGESIVNSVMVMPDDGLAYSHPFVHKQNCIKFWAKSVDGISKEWDVVGTIETGLKYYDLYEIYLESLKAANWYRIDNYVKNYLKPLIDKI